MQSFVVSSFESFSHKNGFNVAKAKVPDRP